MLKLIGILIIGLVCVAQASDMGYGKDKYSGEYKKDKYSGEYGNDKYSGEKYGKEKYPHYEKPYSGEHKYPPMKKEKLYAHPYKPKSPEYPTHHQPSYYSSSSQYMNTYPQTYDAYPRPVKYCDMSVDYTSVSGSCHQFKRCSNGILSIMTCPDNTVWDNKLRTCVPAERVHGPCGTMKYPPKYESNYPVYEQSTQYKTPQTYPVHHQPYPSSAYPPVYKKEHKKVYPVHYDYPKTHKYQQPYSIY